MDRRAEVWRSPRAVERRPGGEEKRDIRGSLGMVEQKLEDERIEDRRVVLTGNSRHGRTGGKENGYQRKPGG